MQVEQDECIYREANKGMRNIGADGGRWRKCWGYCRAGGSVRVWHDKRLMIIGKAGREWKNNQMNWDKWSHVSLLDQFPRNVTSTSKSKWTILSDFLYGTTIRSDFHFSNTLVNDQNKLHSLQSQLHCTCWWTFSSKHHSETSQKTHTMAMDSLVFWFVNNTAFSATSPELYSFPSLCLFSALIFRVHWHTEAQ